MMFAGICFATILSNSVGASLSAWLQAQKKMEPVQASAGLQQCMKACHSLLDLAISNIDSARHINMSELHIGWRFAGNQVMQGAPAAAAATAKSLACCCSSSSGCTALPARFIAGPIFISLVWWNTARGR
jgi:hypothetical protein